MSTDIDLLGGQVAGPLLQAIKFCNNQIATPLEVLLARDRGGPSRVELLLLGNKTESFSRNERGQCGEWLGSVDRFESRLGHRSVETSAVLLALFSLGARFSLGVEVVTVAWAVMPSLRFRLFGGESFSLHALAAVPIAFVDDEESEVFVAGAAGLGLRVHATRNLAFRLEGLVSLAGGDHGTTVPAFAGVELWF